MIIAVGNAPSSGSTYLADLLDTLPCAVCGPELHLFSSRRQFEDYEGVRRNGFRRSATPSCYVTYAVCFAWGQLPFYGMTPEEVHGFLEEETTFRGFCDRFFRRYADHRGKDARLFFEKTPENIHTAGHFLDAFPDSVFLHIVRNPLYVFRSQRRRGLPFSVAAAGWLIDVAAAHALRDHERFYTVHYEELVHDPQGTLSRFLDFIGEGMPIDNLEEMYSANKYRSGFRRSDTWSQHGYGRMGNANEEPLGREDEEAARYMAGLKIDPRFARLFGLREASFDEVAGSFGYSLDIGAREGASATGPIDVKSKLWLAKKWAKDVATMSAKPSDLLAYLAPVERL
ncbi:MAG: sulfotransferase [Alphaproteobacteria bacterium]